MPRKANETDNEYRSRVIDPISDSFCAAKWLNATIWLGNGATTSCHHPPPHRIDPDEVKNDPSALHNTIYKKLVRKELQEGKQSRECEYCWKIENLDKETELEVEYELLTNCYVNDDGIHVHHGVLANIISF